MSVPTDTMQHLATFCLVLIHFVGKHGRSKANNCNDAFLQAWRSRSAGDIWIGAFPSSCEMKQLGEQITFEFLLYACLFQTVAVYNYILGWETFLTQGRKWAMSTKAKPLPGQTLCSPKCAGRLGNFERTCPSSFSLFRCVLSATKIQSE